MHISSVYRRVVTLMPSTAEDEANQCQSVTSLHFRHFTRALGPSQRNGEIPLGQTIFVVVEGQEIEQETMNNMQRVAREIE